MSFGHEKRRGKVGNQKGDRKESEAKKRKFQAKYKERRKGVVKRGERITCFLKKEKWGGKRGRLGGLHQREKGETREWDGWKRNVFQIVPKGGERSVRPTCNIWEGRAKGKRALKKKQGATQKGKKKW